MVNIVGSVVASALKKPNEVGGGGKLALFFSQKVYPTCFMSFLTIFVDF